MTEFLITGGGFAGLCLGLHQVLMDIGVQTKDYGFYNKTGQEICTQPRGHHAGYKWPQFSVHRGDFQVALL